MRFDTQVSVQNEDSSLPRCDLCWCLTHYLERNTFRLEIYDENRSHSLRVQVAAAHKTESVHDDLQETNVDSASNNTDTTFRYEAARKQCLLIFHTLARYAVFPQLQLWHLHWLASVQSSDDLYSQNLRKHNSSLTKTLLPSSKHVIVWMTSTSVTYSIYHCNRYSFDYYKYQRLRAFHSKLRLRIRWSI
jgi:hypothetical protein